MKKQNNFQKEKVSASGYCLAFAFFYSQFKPGVAYKNVLYKNQEQEQDLRNKIFTKYRFCAGTKQII